MGRPIKIAKAQAVVTITATDAATDVVTTSANFTNLGIIAGMPFIPGSNVGGLTAGTTYWILKVITSGANSTFTVSSTPINANPSLTPVDLSDAGPVTVAATIGLVDSGFSNPNGSNTATNSTSYGAVGGNTSCYGSQTLARVAISQTGTGTITVSDDSPNITGVGTDFANTLQDGTAVATASGVLLGYITDIANANATFATFDANSLANATGASFVFANNEAGYLVRQKGKTKYLVTGTTSGLTGACYTANVANAALAPGQMNILATYANSATGYVKSLNDYNSVMFYDTANATAYPSVIATFDTAYAANTYGGQPQPVVVIRNS